MVSQKLSKNFTNVLAFEPCKESFDILDQECPFNVVALNLAVSDTEGIIELHEAARSIQTGQLVSKPGLHWGTINRSRQVPSVTLETLFDSMGVPDFIKVDTEGHEVEVIRGGARVINEFRPRLVIEVHHKHAEHEIRDLLPFYELTTVEQTQFREVSMVRQNHKWLVSDGLL